MSKIINIGSINIDHVYKLPRFVRPGETLTSSDYEIFPGGKGLNQSIACAMAGLPVIHAGCIGNDKPWLMEVLKGLDIDTENIQVMDQPTGHAMIQVIPSGENAIVIYPGANRCVDKELIGNVLQNCDLADMVLLQNEISNVADAIRMAKDCGMEVVFNPAPMTPEVLQYPLELVDLFILNQTEAYGLTGETDPPKIREVMLNRYPKASTLLTLGSNGSMFFEANVNLFQPAISVNAVDTTAAGDTFIGYFLSHWMTHYDAAKAMFLAANAAAICVTREGAAYSIPSFAEVARFILDRHNDN